MLDKKINLEFHANARSINHFEIMVIAVLNGHVLTRVGIDVASENFLLGNLHSDQIRPYLRERITLGQWRGQNCEVWDLEPEVEALQGFDLVELRGLLISLSDTAFSLVSRAVQLIEWRRTYQFCSRCAVTLSQRIDEHAMHCTDCNIDYYPRISPCIIVIVTHQDKCLLARQAKWPEGRYSAIAGFIEAGESAEQAVYREVYEEVGIEVKNISYFGSQSWPFPGQLMLGFRAEAKSTDITVDGVEISEARWWNYQELPEFVPPPTIMSGRLIRSFFDEMSGELSQQ